ncbi:MAG: SRPBCC domain-containing protein [Alphaproteobacteria bacterium]|nr:SRPBCC domain-containing protein [Alphaproteobacteria bacterium]
MTLPVPPERAFALFTQRAGFWWPPGRRHTGDPESDILIEADGRFVERARDGREVPMGEVLEWRPPEALRLSFYGGTGPDRPTEVVVRFEPEGEGTRVLVEHRPTPASEAVWEQRMAVFGPSWETVLASFSVFVEDLANGNEQVT